MALVVRVLALAVTVTAVSEMSSAAVYKVGDSAGWTTIGNVDYKQWAATKTFQLGDVITSPKVPAPHAPAPGSSTAAPLLSLKGNFGLLRLTIATLALVVSGLA